jgi:tetraacyldisaccharide 4'-kinase
MRVIAHGRRWIEELPAHPARWLLAPCWLLYRPLIALRNRAYDRGHLAATRLPVPVISIGNLTAGGTGKTPAALAVVAWLRAQGRNPAIIARGYRGVNGVNEEALLAGDVPVICNPDRLAGGRQAIDAGADCLVLDDGLQHRRLIRDLDIVVIDATRPWGHSDGRPGAVLPLGYQREGRSGLQRAGLFWLSRTDLVDAARLAAICACLPAEVPVVLERMQSATVAPLLGGSTASAALWTGREVVLVSGLGNPAGFEGAVRACGMIPIASHRFPDHHHYTAQEVAEIQRLAGSHPIVTTAKDAVKLRAFPAFPAHVFAMESSLSDARPLELALGRALQREQQAPPRDLAPQPHV